MAPVRNRHSRAIDRLRSLGLALDPSYHQTTQQPYRSNRASQPYPPYPHFFFDDDDVLNQTVACQPSLLLSTTGLNVNDTEGINDVEDPVDEEEINILAAIFKKVVDAVKRAFYVVLKA